MTGEQRAAESGVVAVKAWCCDVATGTAPCRGCFNVALRLELIPIALSKATLDIVTGESPTGCYCWIIYQDDQDPPTFQPMEQMKGSKIKYTGTGYIHCEG